jgi:hypothetical protein
MVEDGGGQPVVLHQKLGVLDEKGLLDLGVKPSHQDVVALPAQGNGAKAFAGKVVEARFRFSQGDRTGCIERLAGLPAAQRLEGQDVN